MGKLRSNRVKRTPQASITQDRYQFLGLEQAEPNLGDAEIGPSSAAANPIKLGRPYQLYAVGEYPGERYWAPAIGGGTSIGVISVYANGLLSSGLFQNITGLNFVGTGVTIESPPVEIADGVGIATVRFTVTDILNRGQVGQVLYNTPSGYAYGADGLYYVSGNVGIGSTLPKQALDVSGNGVFSGTVTATKFIGNIEGTFNGTATTATNVIGGIASVTSLSVSGVSTFGGNLLPSTAGLSIGNPGNRWDNFYVNTIVGNLTGAASSIAVYQDSTDTTRYIPFVDVTSGITTVRTNPLLTFNPSTGNLGIGTATPTSTLHVQGTAQIQSNTGIGITQQIWTQTLDNKDGVSTPFSLMATSDTAYEFDNTKTSFGVAPNNFPSGLTTGNPYLPVVFSHALNSSNGNYDPVFYGVTNLTNIAGTSSTARVNAIGLYNRVFRNSTNDNSSSSSNRLVGIYNHVVQGREINLSSTTETAYASWNVVGIRRGAANNVAVSSNELNVAIGGNIQALVVNGYGNLNKCNIGNAISIGATVTNYYGYYVSATLEGSNSLLSNYYGVYLETPGVEVGGTITNRYSIYSPDAASPMYHAGNLGIGTTTPVSKLHVVGSGITTGEALQVDGNIRVGISTTSNYIAFRGTYDDGVDAFGGVEIPGQYFPYTHTYIGERIYDYSGMGQASELLLFKGNDDIEGNGGPDRIRLAATGGIVFDTSDTFGPAGFSSPSFEQAGVSTHLTTKMVLTAEGNLGIGTTSPSEKLTVSGTVLADGFISVGNTTPIQISLVGNKLTFTASGIGSTTLTLF